jgi:hypothetical protein
MRRRPTMPSPKLKELFGRIYDNGREGERRQLGAKEYERRRHDFVFHMTDWLDDLYDLNKLCRHPEDADVEKATIFVMGLLYHALPHLTTAGRLLLDTISDPFANDWPVEPEKKNHTPRKRSGSKTKVSA